MPGFLASYNAANHLTSAANNGQSAGFVYDGLGRCVKRTLNNVSRIITYDEWKPIYEWDGAGHPFAWNLYGPGADEILWRFQNGVGHLRYHTDSNGNVTTVLDWWGGILEKYTYDAFGKPTAITDRWGTPHVDGNNKPVSWYGNRFMFQGREWIKELGIYDYRRRMYHPGLGRFLQTDPLGLQTEGEKLTAGQKALFSPGGQAPDAFSGSEMNLFRYCGDDPVNNGDPLGLLTEGDYDVVRGHLTLANPKGGPIIMFTNMSSGAGAGHINNPAMQHVQSPDGKSAPAGPIPRGNWIIASRGDKHGASAFRLIPEGSRDSSITVRTPDGGTVKRDLFVIHVGNPGGVGCIVTPSGDKKTMEEIAKVIRNNGSSGTKEFNVAGEKERLRIYGRLKVQ